jgi:hypothetical protein
VSGEWKPGDVAIAQWRHFDGVRAFFSAARQQWIDVDGAEFDGDEDDLTLRPLVVIDPDDREQVERLLRGYSGWKNSPEDLKEYPHYVNEMQAALREFANPTPPKPDEPTGLGAVVEDADGEKWIRTTTPDRDMDNLDKPWANGPVRRHWQIVEAVKVLNAGWSE